MLKIMGHSMRMTQEVYHTTYDADLQGILKVQTVSKYVVSTLIGKLGLSLEEALMN